MEALQKILASFGGKIGIPELKFDEDNYCCLLFDEIGINLETDLETGQIFFSSPLGPIPEKVDQAFFEMLLEANYFYKDTGGASIGINREVNKIQLIYSIPYQGLDQTQFEQIMESLVNLSELWTKRILDYDPVPDDNGKDINVDLRFKV